MRTRGSWSLPDDVTAAVLRRLAPRARVNLALTCRAYHEVYKDTSKQTTKEVCLRRLLQTTTYWSPCVVEIGERGTALLLYYLSKKLATPEEVWQAILANVTAKGYDPREETIILYLLRPGGCYDSHLSQVTSLSERQIRAVKRPALELLRVGQPMLASIHYVVNVYRWKCLVRHDEYPVVFDNLQVPKPV